MLVMCQAWQALPLRRVITVAHVENHYCVTGVNPCAACGSTFSPPVYLAALPEAIEAVTLLAHNPPQGRPLAADDENHRMMPCAVCPGIGVSAYAATRPWIRRLAAVTLLTRVP
jgi:hypothetical protein